MAINTSKKGYRSMDKARKELERQGYRVECVETKGRFIKKKDLFNLFDLFAIKPRESLLVQVKTNKIPALKEYADFFLKYPQFKVEVWVWYDREGFRIIEIEHYAATLNRSAKELFYGKEKNI